MKLGSLFAGIGGFDLAARNCGIETLWQIEIDKFCRKVLKKNFSKVKRYRDIKKIDFKKLSYVDIIAGGFPCQPYSRAGKKRGSKDERNLWPETIKSIRSIRPKYVVLENVSTLLNFKYFGTILRDLAKSGYNAEWKIIPASDFGAKQKRTRLWVIAYLNKDGLYRDNRTYRYIFRRIRRESKNNKENGKSKTANAFESFIFFGNGKISKEEKNLRARSKKIYQKIWKDKSSIRRIINGIPNQMDRVGALGNAIFPPIAEYIFRLILIREKILEKLENRLKEEYNRRI